MINYVPPLIAMPFLLCGWHVAQISAAEKTPPGKASFKASFPEGKYWQEMKQEKSKRKVDPDDEYSIMLQNVRRRMILGVLVLEGSFDNVDIQEVMKSTEKQLADETVARTFSGRMRVAGREARRTTIDAKFSGHAVEVTLIGIATENRLYLLMFSCLGRDGLDRPEFKEFLESFRIKET